MAQRTSDLERYVNSRERVLGGLWVHRDPVIAVDMLATKLGGRALAIEWLLAALDAADAA